MAGLEAFEKAVNGKLEKKDKNAILQKNANILKEISERQDLKEKIKSLSVADLVFCFKASGYIGSKSQLIADLDRAGLRKKREISWLVGKGDYPDCEVKSKDGVKCNGKIVVLSRYILYHIATDLNRKPKYYITILENHIDKNRIFYQIKKLIVSYSLVDMYRCVRCGEFYKMEHGKKGNKIYVVSNEIHNKANSCYENLKEKIVSVLKSFHVYSKNEQRPQTQSQASSQVKIQAPAASR